MSQCAPAAHHPVVLVLGARGRFGAAAVDAFAAAGWQIKAQCRPGRAPVEVRPSVSWITADANDLAGLRHAVGAADVVVHAMNPPYTTAAWAAGAPALMQAAIDAACALGAMLMFPGNVYNFGAAMPERLTEDTPQQPTTAKGRIRVALEAQLMAAAQRRGLKSVVVRAGDFFGSGRGSWFDQVIVKKIAQGRITYPGGLDTPTAWAYLPDLARAFVKVAEQRDALGGATTLHFGGYTLTGRDWVDVLTPLAREHGGLAIGAALKVGGLPWPVLRVGGLLVPTWASLAEMRYLWRTPHRLDNRRLTELVGQEPHTVFSDAVRTALTSLHGQTALRVGQPAARR
ncbi:MAG: NAD-dependent epimerase/dehydratase family protein [Burkholderiales bacterium]|nr:NAD-dependent epimerase/dehydratase family protein [Burkholderiales bacterium]